MAKAKAASAVKVKKKVWYPIQAPAAFKSVMLGETFVAEPTEAVGRIVHANLKDITDNLKDQHIYLKFKIVGLSGTILQTEILSYYLTQSSIRKLTRRLGSRLDESFVVLTQDGKPVRIKPVIVTASKTVRSVCSSLRKLAREHCAREIAKLGFSPLIEKLVGRHFQADARKRLSKAYPVKTFEVKILEFADSGTPEKIVEDSLLETSNDGPKPRKQMKKTVTEEMEQELAQPTGTQPAQSAEEPTTAAAESETFGEEQSS